jgi:hypothetical protein
MAEATLKEWRSGLPAEPNVVTFERVNPTSHTIRIKYRGGAWRDFDWLCLPTDLDPRFPVSPPR